MLQAFTSALLLITSQELGDKTFFIVLILAMRHDRRWVFAGAMLALALMTLIAVAAGQALALFPPLVVHYLFVLLFLGFGVWLLWQASRISADTQEPLEAATAEVQEFETHTDLPRQKQLQTNQPWTVFLEALTLTFIAEWGDRTQLATLALASTLNPWGIIAGGISGHLICTLIAVIGGRWAAGRISERAIAWIGGGLFLLFGLITLLQGPG